MYKLYHFRVSSFDVKLKFNYGIIIGNGKFGTFCHKMKSKLTNFGVILTKYISYHENKETSWLRDIKHTTHFISIV